MMQLQTVAHQLIAAAFKIGAIKIRPEEPFTWASGWKSPIYNDNRMLLWYPELRTLVTEGLEALVNETQVPFDAIAGTSTAGIPHGERLADSLYLPFIYIRDKPKDHGMKNRIEGIDAEKDLDGKQVVLIEDLISTGGSSVAAVQAIRDANGSVIHCFSIFSYGFPKAADMFAAKIPFKGEEKLEYKCMTDSIIRYPELIAYGIGAGKVKKEHAELLSDWSTDPEGWSKRWKESHGITA